MPSSPLMGRPSRCRVRVKAQAGSQGLVGASGSPLLVLCVNQLLLCQASCLHLDISVIPFPHSAWPWASLAGSLLGSVHSCRQPAGVGWGWGEQLGSFSSPQLPDHALASPSSSPSINKSPGSRELQSVCPNRASQWQWIFICEQSRLEIIDRHICEPKLKLSPLLNMVLTQF